MNLVLALFSFLLGNAKNLFKQSGTAISQQMVLHVRAVSIVLITAIGSLVVFCTTLCLLVAHLAAQLEKNDEFAFTTSTTLYLVIVLLSLGILLYSLRRKTWLKTMNLGQPEKKAGSSPIENAIALLIMDFVESRKENRHEEAKNPTAS